MTGKAKEARNRFSKEFRINAIDLLMKTDKTMAETAISLGVRQELLYRQKANYLANQLCSPGQPSEI
jgi:transposase-like protein